LKKLKCLLAVLTIVLAFVSTGNDTEAATKQTIHNSPYVTFTSDGNAWTTHKDSTGIEVNPNGTEVVTGITSSLRALNEGEHYYDKDRIGEVPVGKWLVTSHGKCIHKKYPTGNYHGLAYGTQLCKATYFSGWLPFCADCGERFGVLVYMSKAAAESIDYVDVGVGEYVMEESNVDYYYRCPFCTNLEQGAAFTHECKAVSYNRYEVVYDRNHDDISGASGFMAESYHMYNNATEYEGWEVTPVTHLTLNNYKRRGYEFVEWNTKPDGSGDAFADGAEIFNLSKADCSRPDTWTADDNGTVTLYAQWRRSESTLVVNPNGGTYLGSTSSVSITQEYSSTYTIEASDVVCPAGYKISFHADGGVTTDYDSGEVITSITSEKVLKQWSMVTPINGTLSRNRYTFNAPDGNVDEVKAVYETKTITLPNCTKEGYSFGGWYADSALTRCMGEAGDVYTPVINQTMYACWVELTLTSEDNYTANGGKGAVDLSWNQSDGQDKVYKVYQSTNLSTWNIVAANTDIGSSFSVGEEFDYTGRVMQYTVPYSGNYILNAYGGQGGRIENKNGGKGGAVRGTLYLDAGEKLTIEVGGKNGYNGGGDGDPYANGGGATTIESNKKGMLLIAGGGGGATEYTVGEPGGAQNCLREDGMSEGESGGAGGGAGHIGGIAGEYEVHNCVPECSGLSEADSTFYNASGITDKGSLHTGNGNKPTVKSDGVHASKATGSDGWVGYAIRVGSSTNYLSTPKTGKLNFTFSTEGNHLRGDFTSVQYKVTVYNKDTDEAVYEFDAMNAHYTETTRSRKVCSKSGCTSHNQVITTWNYTDPEVTGYRESYPKVSWTHDGSWSAKEHEEKFNLSFDIPIPENIQGVYLKAEAYVYEGSGTSGTWIEYGVTDVSYDYAACGYEDGQIIASSPAYGGSNYIKEDAMTSFTYYTGQQRGDGRAAISSGGIGYVNALSMEGVTATDNAKPSGIHRNTVVKTPLGTNRVEVSWNEPADNGTLYYHKVTSHLKGSNAVLCTSNVTSNTLKTGVKKYYYVVDTLTDTVVTDGGSYSMATQPKVTVSVEEEVKYLHVAAVDGAGNISNTLHIKIDAKPSGGSDDILWNLSTGPISVEDTNNTHQSATDTWYVKADGEAPFALMFDAFLEGTASLSYQPNYSIFHTECGEEEGENILFTKSHEISAGNIVTRAQDLTYSTTGTPALMQYPYMVTERSNKNTQLRTTQKFTLDSEYHGKEIRVFPRTGAKHGSEVIYSDETMDRLHTITLIGDGEAPTITGMEDMDITEVVEIYAEDALSGIGEFYVEVINVDSFDKVTFYPEADGVVRIDMEENGALFEGDLQVRAVAVDNVGNETESVVAATEFSMSAVIERILSPHEPIFKCGESGVLSIVTYGYADRIVVEFPAALETENTYSREFTYATPSYMAEEQIQFMVPLSTGDGDYVVKVTAYKNGREMEKSEPIMVVNGTVLSELRTRLR